VPLFTGLSGRQLKRLSRLFKERRFAAGRPVVKQSEMSGVGFFVISGGEASVTVDGTYLKRLGTGDYFGELALISQQVRTATVTADTPLICQVISFWDFRSFAKDNPEIAWKLLQRVVDLLMDERDRFARASLQTS
jgi:CPA1 family monovalent cation:H+ antiporter